MKAIEIIDSARTITYDSKITAQTWKNKEYLKALNTARSLLFSRRPESRAAGTLELEDFVEIEEAAIAEEMTEDETYRLFFIAYVVSIFFESNAYDTRSAQNADRQLKNYLWALGLGGSG